MTLKMGWKGFCFFMTVTFTHRIRHITERVRVMLLLCCVSYENFDSTFLASFSNFLVPEVKMMGKSSVARGRDCSENGGGKCRREERKA